MLNAHTAIIHSIIGEKTIKFALNMKINKQLFEDVLSGKLKGTFVLRNGDKFNSLILRHCNRLKYPYLIGRHSYDDEGSTGYLYNYDIINFIPDTDMKQNELTIEIPDGKEIDWDESKKQNKIVLKDKQLTYKDICKKLLENNFYFIDNSGSILCGFCGYTPNCAKT
jgi:hypothetical protein